MATTRTFDDEITYPSEPTPVAIPSHRTSVRVMGLCPESAVGTPIAHPLDAREIFRPMMLADRETLAVMLLDARRTVITAFVASVGSANEVTCNPQDIFRPAMLLGASAILIAHNHPSGDPRPSDADVQTTQMIDTCASILGILLVDHLVLTTGEKYRSVFEYMEKGF